MNFLGFLRRDIPRAYNRWGRKICVNKNLVCAAALLEHVLRLDGHQKRAGNILPNNYTKSNKPMNINYIAVAAPAAPPAMADMIICII